MKKIEYIIKNNEATITRCGDFYKGDVVIPDIIDGCPVTSIDDFAFYNCNSLKSITIPDSVTSIGGHAFWGCDNLTSITIPDSVTSIGVSAFWGCYSLTSVTIGNSVTSIDVSAFYNCNSLKSITIPDSVTNIDGHAFDCCISLTSITIPDSVTSIGNCAFWGCTELKSPLANYKAFILSSDGKISCRDYEFHENKWSDEIKNVQLCKSGYHYCTNLFEIFNYYSGTLDKDIAIYLCEVGDEVVQSDTSKCVTNRIKPVKRLYREDIRRLLNN